MKTLDVRRHSLRDRPHEHLSTQGQELAEEVGRSAEGFHTVVTSPVLRAVETAAAMGFPAQRTDDVWATLGDDLLAEVSWPQPFHAYAVALARGGATARVAARLVGAAISIVEGTPEDRASLVITHGGIPELLTVALLPTVDARPWGEALRCLEGVRLGFEGGRAIRAGVLRLAPERTRM